MTRDPMTVPIIFLRIGWMNRNQGQTAADQITCGGAFVKDHGYGHEIFSFQPFARRVFACVQPPGTAYNDQPGPSLPTQQLRRTASRHQVG